MEMTKCAKCDSVMPSFHGVAVRAGGTGTPLHEGLLCSECAEIVMQVWDAANESRNSGCLSNRTCKPVDPTPKEPQSKPKPKPKPNPLSVCASLRKHSRLSPKLPVDHSEIMSDLGEIERL